MIVHRRVLDLSPVTCKRAKFQQEVSSRILQERETCLSSGHKRHDAPHLSQREFTFGFDGILWREGQPMALDQPRGVEWEFGAADTSPFPSRPRMSWFKKSKKSRQPSRQPASLGIPTHIAVGLLGISADLAPEIGSEGAFCSVKPSKR